MLTLSIPKTECYDEAHECFIEIQPRVIHLEHSLISISKWESKWHKPFLDDSYVKTRAENIDYIRCMTIDGNVDPTTYFAINGPMMEQINAYLSDPMTATTIKNQKRHQAKRGRKTTSETIYSQMVALDIPFECEKWNLNRLFMLIAVCSEENEPSKKMGKKDIMKQNADLNKARRAKRHSKG